MRLPKPGQDWNAEAEAEARRRLGPGKEGKACPPLCPGGFLPGGGVPEGGLRRRGSAAWGAARLPAPSSP